MEAREEEVTVEAMAVDLRAEAARVAHPASVIWRCRVRKRRKLAADRKKAADAWHAANPAPPDSYCDIYAYSGEILTSTLKCAGSRPWSSALCSFGLPWTCGVGAPVNAVCSMC